MRGIQYSKKISRVLVFSIVIIVISFLSILNPLNTILSEASPYYTVSIPFGTSVPGCEETNECFIPDFVEIFVGDTITWFNDDTAAHTVTSGTVTEGPDGFFDSSLVVSGNEFSVTFNQPGTFPYFCMVHPWMVGQVIVKEGISEESPISPEFFEDIPPELFLFAQQDIFEQQEIELATDEKLVTISEDILFPGCEESQDCYDPNSLSILQGETVVWYNAAFDATTITSGTPEEGPDGEFDSSLLPPGQFFFATFYKVGEYKYFSMIQPWATGVIKVLPDEERTSESIPPIEQEQKGKDILVDGCPVDSNPKIYRLGFKLERIRDVDKEKKTFDATFIIQVQGSKDTDFRTEEAPKLEYVNSVGDVKEKPLKQKSKTLHEAKVTGKFVGDYTFDKYPFEKIEFPIIIETGITPDKCVLTFHKDVLVPNHRLLEELEITTINGLTLKNPKFNVNTWPPAEYYPEYTWKRAIFTVEGEGDDKRDFLKSIFPIMLMTSLACIVFWLPKEFMTKIQLNALFLISVVFFTQISQNANSFITYFTNYDTIIISSYIIFLISIAIPAIQMKFEKSGKQEEKISKVKTMGRIVLLIAIGLAILISATLYLNPS
jgi:plastocyanin